MADAREIAVALGRGKQKYNGPGKGYNTYCPSHADNTNPSLSVKDSANGKVMLHCHAGCSPLDVIERLKEMKLWSGGRPSKNWKAQPRAPEGVKTYTGEPHYKLGKPARYWTYFDAEGRARGSVARFDEFDDTGKVSKTTLPLTWCRCEETGEEKWQWKGFPEPRTPYREDQLVKSRLRHVLIVEGEKTAEIAQELVGDVYVVITWQGGAKAVHKTDWKHLKGRDVTLWPDADVPGDNAMRALAEILLTVDAKVIRRVELPEGLPQGWDLADDIPDDVDVKELLHSAKPYIPLGDEVVERFNRRFAMTMVGGQAVVLEEEVVDGRPRVNYLSVAGFSQFYGNRSVVSGKSTVPEPVYWMKHPERRSYRSVTFKPVDDTPGQYNLWRGFSVEPDPTGSWDLLKTHIFENIARGDESVAKWVTTWFAHLIQHPDKKLGTSLSIRGKQGTGKTILGQCVGELFRPHYVLVDRPSFVVSNFNAHMSSCLLLHADEAFFAGSPQNVGLLRGMVTGDTIRIEQKGKDSFELQSYMRLYVSSNHSWVVPAGFEERRFAVLDIGDGRMQDRDFFQALLRQMNNGGYGAMLHDLQRWDLSSVDISKVPQTRALQEQKFHSLDTATRFWFEKLYLGSFDSTGQWSHYVVVSDLHDDYVKTCVAWGEPRRMDLQSFTREIKKFWPIEPKKIRVTIKRVNPNSTGVHKGERPWGFPTSSLEQHRKFFSEYMGGSVDWSEGDADSALSEAIDQKRVVDRQDDIPF